MEQLSLEAFEQKVHRWMRTSPEVLEKYVSRGAELIVKHIMQNKLTYQVLGIRSGTLRKSQAKKVKVEPTRITAKIGTAVWYGKLWETGSAVGPKGPVTVRHPRPFIRPSINEKKPMFMQEVLNGMMEAYKRA